MLAVLEIIGVFGFGMSGALMAVRRGYDLVGILVLAVLTATGGGVLRDLLLGITPPAVFTDWPIFTAALASALVTFIYHPVVERMEHPLAYTDAAGLAFFCVAGAVKALDMGVSPLPAAAVGLSTGIGGGVMRDVISRETPVILRPESELYALPAIGGTLIIALLWTLEIYEPAYGMVIALGIITVRLLAVRNHWHAPVALAAPKPDRRPPA